jgi:hypothetical protein
METPILFLRVKKEGYVKTMYEKNIHIGPLLDRNREDVGQKLIPTTGLVQTAG